MLELVLMLTLQAEPLTHKPATPKAKVDCPVGAMPDQFDHARHVAHLEAGQTSKVGGCHVCHDLPRNDHGCEYRLHAGFNCRTCHLRIPGLDKPQK